MRCKMKKLVLLMIVLTATLSGCKKEETIESITCEEGFHVEGYIENEFEGTCEANQVDAVVLSELEYYSYLNDTNPVVTISVRDYGDIELQLFPSVAPTTVDNFVQYITDGDFENNEFHRVVEGFVIQGGRLDTPACNIKGEFNNNGIQNDLKHTMGVLSMARVGGINDSQTSQFFIMHEASDFLDNDYTGFGGVVSGFVIVDMIAKMEEGTSQAPSSKIIIDNITVDLKGQTYNDRTCAADYVAPLPEINVPEEGTIVLEDLPYFDYLLPTNPVVTITIKEVGTIEIELFPSVAPNTVNNIIKNINDGVYTDNEFHSVVNNLIISGGKTESSTCYITTEATDNGIENPLSMTRGVIGMSRTPGDFDSISTGFFLLQSDYLFLDGAYAGFGGVISGFNVLDYLAGLQSDSGTTPEFALDFESITVNLNGYVPIDPICVN